MAVRRAAVLTLSWLLSACAPHAEQAKPVPPPAVSVRPGAQPWPEGSALFRRAPRFVGGDSAYSVALDPERVLWLFGDTFVDPAEDGSRSNGPNFFVRNSVA